MSWTRSISTRPAAGGKRTNAKAIAMTFACIAIASGTGTAAHAQRQTWLTQFGTSEKDSAWGLTPDGAGGVIVAGDTWGNLVGRSAGLSDAFIVRYDLAGHQVWLRQFGTDGSDVAWALASDGAGGVIVGGWTSGSLGGTNAGKDDGFLARYTNEGDQVWIKQFGTIENDYVYNLAPDGAGGVMVVGGTVRIIASPNAGYRDTFLARYDSDGNRLWHHQFNTPESDTAWGLASDGAGGVIVAGGTDGDLGGPSAGRWDAFVARFDGAGNQIWIRQFGTSSRDMAVRVAADGQGGAIVVGDTLGSLGGPHAGSIDVFLTRFDGAGNQLWIRQFGTNNVDTARDIVPDGEGGVVINGHTSGSLGGRQKGRTDAFIARYDNAGNQIWLRQFGTNTNDESMGLATDGTGSVVIAGRTTGDMARLNAGNWDLFLASYTIDSCYADCDDSTGNGVLDIFDFLCWQNDFVTGNSYACDCDTSTGFLVCDMLDFICYQEAFISGCP